MKLPNADQAIIDIAKLRDYCLNPTHSRGRHKARVFAAVLGITEDNAELLRATLLHVALTDEATVAEQDAYGQRYVIDFLMRTPYGEAIVRSAWIIRVNEQNPRLTSCYIL